VRPDLAERDPITDAVAARGGMLLIGLLFIAFTQIIRFALWSGLQDFFASVGNAIDVWQFLFYLIATLVCLPLIACIKHFFMPSEDQTIKAEITKQLRIFSISRHDWTRQLKHALLMWLVVFVPLDLISYLIPGMLEFQANSLYAAPSGSDLGSGLYFTIPVFGVFIGFSILVHFFVAMREETLYRGVLQFWGQEKAGMTSAMVISAIFFGLSHFSYWFNDMTQPVYYPVWWGASGLFVGVMLSFYLRTTGRILPMILAHWWNNVVSTIAVWMFFSSGNAISTMTTLGYMLYLPLILCGIVLLFLWRSTLRNVAKKLKKEIKSYLNQSPYLIFFDIIFGIGIWLFLVLLGG
jgi:membrane protease YdiL (CAAX protease family)